MEEIGSLTRTMIIRIEEEVKKKKKTHYLESKLLKLPPSPFLVL